MKKLLVLLSVAAFAACGSGSSTEAAADSVATVVDSTADAKTDSVSAAADSTNNMIDSTAKATVDTLKK